MNDLTRKLQANSALIEQKLDEILSLEASPGEIARPARLVKAMRHSVLGGGKRLRPFLVIETAKLFGVDQSQSVEAAAAIELIHCYSLVHDDLPAMDDDDLRRGKPTVHREFDEATAILAGDSLLTLAFKILTCDPDPANPTTNYQLLRLYADAAGLGGMAGGQMFDLEAESSELSEDETLLMQSMKTGALIRCACEAGAVLGDASPEDRTAIVRYGELVGQAFQLADDILDVTSDAATMGKNTSKDADRGKATLVDLVGIDAAKNRANALKDEAISTLSGFGIKRQTLAELASYMVERRS